MLRLGPVRADGFGLRAADWPEIEAFARLTGRISAPWEAETLFDMCSAYADALQDGAEPLAIAPMDQDPPLALTRLAPDESHW